MEFKDVCTKNIPTGIPPMGEEDDPVTPLQLEHNQRLGALTNRASQNSWKLKHNPVSG